MAYIPLNASRLAVRLCALGAIVTLVGCHEGDTRQTSSMGLDVTGLRVDGLAAPMGIDDNQPRFSWKSVATRRDVMQRAYALRVSEGDATQAIWSTGTRQDNRQLGIVYQGPTLKPQTIYHWQVRITDDKGTVSAWSKPATFETGLGVSTQWPAQWIGGATQATSLPLLRRDFPLAGTLTRARLYATARGTYTLSINGKPVSADRLAPGWTDYGKQIDYQTYDVTGLLATGTNTLAAMIGPGWYAGHIASFGAGKYGTQPAFLARLRLDFADGHSQWIDTDAQWRTTAGPLLDADMIMGERYDARRLPAHWNTAAADLAAWSPVTLLPGTGVTLAGQADQPVRVTGERKATMLERQPTANATLFDLGQNMVGVLRLHLHGKAGQTVRIRYGEVLNTDGSLYTANLRSAKATDWYTFAEDGEAIYTPIFTFHGFRYAEIQGNDTPLAATDVTGLVIGSDLPMTGTFETSSAMLNQLQSNIVWGQRGNFVSIPTDTPARDERLGWAGDINVFAPTASYNADTQAFLAKWVRDLRDAQQASGDYTGVAPNPVGIGGGAGWSDAGITVPYTLYMSYGDTRAIDDGYASMQAFMAFIEKQAGPTLRRSHGEWGDWLHLDDPTSAEIIGTAYLAYDARMMSQMSAATGHAADSQHYADLATRATAAFREHYLTADGRLSGNSQTAYALAIGMQLLPADAIAPAADHLAERVASRHDHLSTGFLGTPWLLDALDRGGHLPLAYRLLLNTDYPSWGYEVTSGATTMWERWNSLKPDGTFGDVAMNSFNHYAYGAVGDWMYRHVAGIAPAAPGYAKILFAPQPGGGLTSASGSIETVYGKVASAWSLDGNVLTLHVVVPVNTTATVNLPTVDTGRIEANGQPLDHLQGVTGIAAMPGQVTFGIGSGSYDFKATMATPADMRKAP